MPRSTRSSGASPQVTEASPAKGKSKKTIAKKSASTGKKWENGKNLDEWHLPPAVGSYLADEPLDEWFLPPCPGRRG